jgi:hypothetical protein
MSDSKATVDLTGATFVLGVFVLIVLFWGEPDLHDAIIESLMGSNGTTLEASD